MTHACINDIKCLKFLDGFSNAINNIDHLQRIRAGWFKFSEKYCMLDAQIDSVVQKFILTLLTSN